MRNVVIGCAVAAFVAMSAKSEARPPTAFPSVRLRAVVPLACQQIGLASWYGDKFQGCETASGEPFNMNALTAAHPDLPLGCKVLVTNLKNDKSLVVRVNDRGPVQRGRLLDLSKAAAQRLGLIGSGTALVAVRPLAYPKGYVMAGRHTTRLSACARGTL